MHQRLLRTMDCERFSRRPKQHHSCHGAQSAFHFVQWLYQHNLFEIHVRLAKIVTPTNRTVEYGDKIENAIIITFSRFAHFSCRNNLCLFLTYTSTDGTHF